MEEPRTSYCFLEVETCDYSYVYDERLGWHNRGTPNRTRFARALQARGREGREVLAAFEAWMIRVLGLAPSTAKRKRRIVWACICDHPEAPADKYHRGHEGERCRGVSSWSFKTEIRRALYDFCCWVLDQLDDLDLMIGYADGIIDSLEFNRAEIDARLAVIGAVRNRRENGGREKRGRRPRRRR